MSIRVRLIFTLSMLLGLMASQVIITVGLMSRIADMSTDISTNHLTQMKRIYDIHNDLISFRTTSELLEQNINTNNKGGFNFNDLQENIKIFEENYTGSLELIAFKEHYNEFLKNYQLLFTFGHRSDVVFNGLNESYEELLKQVEILQQESANRIHDYSLATNTVVERTRYLLSAALLLVTVVEIVLGWHLARSISAGLNTLLSATRKVTQGNLSQPIEWNTPDEFGHLARSFNAMLRSLRAAHTENIELNKETVNINEERIRLLRERLSQTVRAQEDERQRIARELHDQAGQALTALKLGLGHFQKQAPEKLFKQVEELKNLTVTTMEDIRNLSLDLRPSMLDDLGLIPTIRQYCKMFARRTGINVDLDVPESFPRQQGEVEITVFRVIQEALTNTAKHAKAKNVLITLETGPSELNVNIEDDGIGFEVEKALRKQGKESIGLFGIRERIELLEGSFSIISTPGNGTLLEFTVPISETETMVNTS